MPKKKRTIGIKRLSGTITLLTDFGTSDTFVGVMKGVILSIAPHANVVDLTHSIPAQDIRAAAFHIACAVGFFPEGTVHVVVVDPGVGSERDAIVVRAGKQFFVAPDNGVLSVILDREPPHVVVRLSNRKYWLPKVSNTFHGRDVFAPVAAHLTNGVPMEKLGPVVGKYVRIDLSQPRKISRNTLEGHVQHVDRFGNCITDVSDDVVTGKGPWVCEVAGKKIKGLSESYSSVETGKRVMVAGSSGYLEIAVRDGSAAEKLNLAVGDRFVLSTVEGRT